MTIRGGFNFGFEQEFFVEDRDGTLVLPPENVARDNAGYLVEARGRPYPDITEAIFSLEASLHKIAKALGPDLSMSDLNKAQLPERLKLEAYRKYGLPKKDKLIANLYDEALTDEQLEYQYAGTHVNISKVGCKFIQGRYEYETVPFDHVPIVKWLDDYFRDEIKEAGRLRGSYSIKVLEGGYGLEYRSLPNSIPTYEVSDCIYYEKNLLDALMIMKEQLNL